MKTCLVGLLATCSSLNAETLRCAGILGNSGEQGAALVRFETKIASGIGTVYDSSGSLWDRAGDGRLNRYAVDGRLLASYRLPTGGSEHDKDAIVALGDSLLLKIGKKLYVLREDASPDSEPVPLPVEATRLSTGSRDGWAAAANDKEVFLVNALGETKPVATTAEKVEDLEIGPGDGIYAGADGKLRRVDEFGPADRRGPWPSPGDRPQWLAGSWFGSAWHGTLRRFSPELLPDPGVVLGGASGSFIGYVAGNHEINASRGLASLGGELFAASGTEGILHLLEWHPPEQRFTILRRIGAVPACSALALDGKDRLWFYSGFWDWSDGPDMPLRHSVPPPEAPGFAGAATLPSGAIVAPGIRWGKPALYYGSGDGPAGLSEDIPLPAKAVACAAVKIGNRQGLLVTDAEGKGRIFFVSGEGKYEGDGGPAELRGATPFSAITSLSTNDSGTLFAASDGQLVVLKQEEGGWREERRWRSWGESPDAHFGKEIHLCASGNRLWVADTERQRVLCFNSDGTLAASFGSTDRSGDDLASLNAPRTIAARGQKAILHDSGNQRLIKLEVGEK